MDDMEAKAADAPPFIPGFNLIEACGRGGNGTVYLGIDPGGVRRAVRVARRSSERTEYDPGAIALYRDLARHSTHLIDILYFGNGGGFFYYVMPLADGAPDRSSRYRPLTLADRISRGTYPFQARLNDLRAVTGAVRKLHENGLAHRDLKPENIVYVGGVLKVADPGSLRPLAHMGCDGTPEFRPETLSSGRDTDIHAIGKLIYCMFSGLPPERYPEPPPWWRTEFFRRVNRIMLRCCAEEPSRRYADIAELESDLDRLEPFAVRFGAFRVLVVTAPWLLLVGSALLLLATAWRPSGSPPQRRIAAEGTAAIHREHGPGDAGASGEKKHRSRKVVQRDRTAERNTAERFLHF